MGDKVPGSHHLSSQARRMWDFTTSPKELPHFRKVCYNTIHEFCHFVCKQPSCEGCQVLKLKAWAASMKKLPSTMEGTPVIRDLDWEQQAVLEAKAEKTEVISEKEYTQEQNADISKPEAS